jgi:phosphotransferase family enzyme
VSSTSHTDHDAAWLPVLERRLGAAVRILGRAPLTGGYVADSVERVELAVGGRERTVVLKAAGPVEVAAMRAVAVVAAAPQALAIGPDWLVLPFVDAPPLAPADPVPDPVWRTLAAVHAHWLGRRPRGVPVVDAAWWAALCDYTLVAVRGGRARTGEREFADAERALLSWRTDPAIAGALARMPRTLVHGDAHRGNILGDVLIDWGNARVAPAALDRATLCAQDAIPPPWFPEPPAAEQHWAVVQVHVQYLRFAADHLGAARVGEMVETAAAALARLHVEPGSR